MSLVLFHEKFDEEKLNYFLKIADTNSLEIVPSFIFGSNWTNDFLNNEKIIYDLIFFIKKKYNVFSMQSLTYGLDICLCELQEKNKEWIRRIESIGLISKKLDFKNLVLGSPNQKFSRFGKSQTIDFIDKDNLIRNIDFLINNIPQDVTLSLEHNTKSQGAKIINKYKEVLELVLLFKEKNNNNIGINLDTACILNEYENLDNFFAENSDIKKHPISSIQIGNNFLDIKDNNLKKISSLIKICYENYGSIPSIELLIKEPKVFKKELIDITNWLKSN